MKPYDNPTVVLFLLLSTLLTTGCTAHELSSDTAQVPPAAQVAQSNPVLPEGLFVKNENLEPAYFARGQYDLHEASMEKLKGNVDWLKKNMPLHIEVAGYSDGLGTPEQNLAVGQRRAAALRDFYVAMGIPRSRISTLTMGQEEPVCFAQTEECRSQNRRAETLIENKELASR